MIALRRPVHRAQSDDADADNALIEAVARRADRIVLGDRRGRTTDGTTTIFGGGEGLEYSGATPADTLLSTNDERRRDRGRMRVRAAEARRRFAIAAARAEARGKARPRRRATTALDRLPRPAGTFPTLSFADVEHGRLRRRGGARQDRRRRRDRRARRGPARRRRRAATADVAAPRSRRRRSPPRSRGFPLHDAGRLARRRCSIARSSAAVAPLVALRFGALVGVRRGRWSRSWRSCVGAQLAFDDGTIVAVVPPLGAALVGGLARHRRSSAPAPRRRRSTALLDRLDRDAAATSARAGCGRCCCSAPRSASSPSTLVLTRRKRAAQRSSYATVDQRFAIRGAQPPPNDVVRRRASTTRRSTPSRSRPSRSTASCYAEGDPQPHEGGREGDRVSTSSSREDSERPEEGRQRS